MFILMVTKLRLFTLSTVLKHMAQPSVNQYDVEWTPVVHVVVEASLVVECGYDRQGSSGLPSQLLVKDIRHLDYPSRMPATREFQKLKL